MKVLYIILLLPALLFADMNAYNMTHTVKARPIALGGAFMAVPGGISSAMYNPATLSLERYRSDTQFSLYLNPLGAISMIHDYSAVDQERPLTTLDHIHMAGTLIKGLAFSRPFFSSQLVLSEPLYSDDAMPESKDPDAISSKHILDSNFDVLMFNLKLADQISIGASMLMFTTMQNSEIEHTHGTAYGIYLRPYTTFSVGICFYDIPNHLADLFFKNTRIPDETINVGIRVTPIPSLSANLDIRNVSEEENDIIREVHSGLEWTLGKIASLRTGYYYEKEIKTHVYSAGLGLFSNNLFHSTDNAFDTGDFIVNYGIQIRSAKPENDLYHYLTVKIRI